MLDLSGWMPYVAVLAIAYTAYVLISESFNPFKTKKNQSHRRHRLAKSVAMVLLIVVTTALIVKPYLGLSLLHLILAAAALGIILLLHPLYKFTHSKKAVSPVLKTDTEKLATASPSTAIENKAQVQSFPAIATISANQTGLAAHELTTTEKPDTTAKQPSISISEEHQLELEISDVNNGSNFDDLDQTIAEAHFVDADLTLSETNQIAHPDRSTFTDDDDSLSDQPADLPDGLPAEDDSALHANTKSSNPTDTLLEILSSQNEKIQRLANNNQSLIKDRENLAAEVSNLKFSLKKVNAIARKGIEQRDQALELKNKALTLAAMERKKRKLTEIKARKALLKMSGALKTLT